MKQFIRLTALLIIIGVVVTTMVSCGKRLNEDKLDKASLFFASELSGKNSDDIDDSALKEIFEKAQERYAEDIVYYEFMYYFFKLQQAQLSDEQYIYTFYQIGEQVDGLNRFSTEDDLYDIIDTIRNVLGE